MANPSKRDAAAQKVVSGARAIIAYQIGLSVGVQRMSRALTWLAPFEPNLPTVFKEYLDETRALPIGSERLQWDRSILQEKDIALDQINQRFRSRVMEACWTLIDRFSEPAADMGKGYSDRDRNLENRLLGPNDKLLYTAQAEEKAAKKKK